MKIRALLMMVGCIPLTAFAGWQLTDPSKVSVTIPYQAVPKTSSTTVASQPVPKALPSQPMTVTPPPAAPSPIPAPAPSGFQKTQKPIAQFIEPWEEDHSSFSSVNYKGSYRLDLMPGSLKTNLDRIMKGQPWILLWNDAYDYEVIGHAQIVGKDFYDALQKLLQDYPVQAVFYQQNHIVTIIPRVNS